ncbi:MAG: hypothetical protein SOH81_06670 [Acetobacter sp.]|jgi:site-specific DNA recombinase
MDDMHNIFRRPGAQTWSVRFHVMKKMTTLEARKEELEQKVANTEEPPPLLHPNMAEIYQQRIASLYESLQAEETKTEAAERLRTLVSQITLQLADGELAIILRGDLAAILQFAAHKKNATVHPDSGVLDAFVSQVSLVAGACNQRKLLLVSGFVERLAA